FCVVCLFVYVLFTSDIYTLSLHDALPISVSIESREDGSYRVDMGVNFAGWTKIKVKGNPGDTIRFMYSEREKDDMTFALNSAYVDRKSTRLNSSHVKISYAVFCLKKKINK